VPGYLFNIAGSGVYIDVMLTAMPDKNSAKLFDRL
jgi:hypothetical protein